MLKGKVAVASVDLKDKVGAGSKVIRKLAKDTEVQIFELRYGNLRVVEKTDAGFVPASGVTIAFDTETIPPPANPGQLSKKDGAFFGPEGWFGSASGPGMQNLGTMTIGQFVGAQPPLLGSLSPSRIAVMRAVSKNEGNLEAINTYDNAFLSIGIYQWTAGPGTDPGELEGLLYRYKTTEAAAFNNYFGGFGLDIDVPPPKPGVLHTGFMVLSGKTLKTPADKAVLRDPIWAYRFWRAAHDNSFRACQIQHAVSRIDIFHDVPLGLPGGLHLKEYVTSEYGIALLLDQHINRPGHVPKTLVTAISQYVSQGGAADPKSWSTDDENKMLDIYVIERAKTSMTDSTKRADAIRQAVTDGIISDKRGSFV
jgi:hypothetical protein